MSYEYIAISYGHEKQVNEKHIFKLVNNFYLIFYLFK